MNIRYSGFIVHGGENLVRGQEKIAWDNFLSTLCDKIRESPTAKFYWRGYPELVYDKDFPSMKESCTVVGRIAMKFENNG
jgi:hypothetical protein